VCVCDCVCLYMLYEGILELVCWSECTAGCFVLCVCVRCLWDSFEQVWGSECTAGGFVVCVSCVCDALGHIVAGLGE